MARYLTQSKYDQGDPDVIRQHRNRRIRLRLSFINKLSGFLEYSHTAQYKVCKFCETKDVQSKVSHNISWPQIPRQWAGQHVSNSGMKLRIICSQMIPAVIREKIPEQWLSYCYIYLFRDPVILCGKLESISLKLLLFLISN